MLGPSREVGHRSSRFGVLLEPYLYLSPALVLIALVMFVPLIVGLSYAFQNIAILNPFKTGFVGLDHFRTLLFSDKVFWRSLINTLWWTGGLAVFPVFFGTGPGASLEIAGSLDGALSRRSCFSPGAVPTFLSGLTWAWLFNPVIGPPAPLDGSTRTPQ